MFEHVHTNYPEFTKIEMYKMFAFQDAFSWYHHGTTLGGKLRKIWGFYEKK